MTNTQPTQFDKQKLKALKTAITQSRKATCSLSHALSRGTAREELLLAQLNAYNLLSDSVYSYLASLADESIEVSDQEAISVLRAYGDYMQLSSFYARYAEDPTTFYECMEGMIKAVNQAMLGEEDDRFELLGDLVRGGREWQEARC